MLVLAMQFSRGACVVGRCGPGRRAGDALSPVHRAELEASRGALIAEKSECLRTPSKRNRGRRHQSVDGGEPESSIRRRHRAAE